LLIAAFMVRPDLLLLDEPTSGLDPLMEREFRNLVLEVRERGQTVFLSSHILSEVEAVCERVAILRAGHLVEVGRLDDMRHPSATTPGWRRCSAPRAGSTRWPASPAGGRLASPSSSARSSVCSWPLGC